MTWVPLKRVADVAPSNVDKISVEGELPVRLVNYTDVYYGDRLTPDMDFMRATASPREVAKFRVHPGDVIMTKDSETADDIGIPAFVESSAPDLVCGYHLSLVRPRTAYGRYLHYAISATHARDQMAVAATGVTRFGLRSESIESLSVWVPPAAEQRAVADYLDTETARIDALITKKREMIRLAELRRAMVLESALGSHGCELPGNLDHAVVASITVPSGWRVPKLSNVLRQLTNGYVGPTRDILRDEGVRYIQGLHVKAGRIDFDRRPYYVEDAWHSARPRTALRGGDVVIVQTGDIGQCAVIPDDFGDANCHALLIARCERHLATGDYLATYLQSDFGRHSLLRLATGALHPHLEFGIRDARIVLPPLEEQKSIVREVRSAQARIDGLASRLHRQIDLLVEHRQALITAAVTGELEIPVAA